MNILTHGETTGEGNIAYIMNIFDRIETGKRFSKLVAVKSLGIGGMWEFKCDCGTSLNRKKYDVESRRIVSCGCAKKERIIQKNKEIATRDGMTHTSTGASWTSMMTRCYNSKTPNYAHYGAKGVRVCEFLRATPLNIILKIGTRPVAMSLDRIDGKMGYYCGGCAECLKNEWPLNIRWASRVTQNRNQARNNFQTIRGETRCLSEWAEVVGLPYSTVQNRASRGKTGEDLIKPKQNAKYIRQD